MHFEEITDVETQHETAFESVETDIEMEGQEPEDEEDEVVEEETSEDEAEEA